jgi:hypothetical protein
MASTWSQFDVNGQTFAQAILNMLCRKIRRPRIRWGGELEDISMTRKSGPRSEFAAASMIIEWVRRNSSRRGFLIVSVTQPKENAFAPGD